MKQKSMLFTIVALLAMASCDREEKASSNDIRPKVPKSLPKTTITTPPPTIRAVSANTTPQPSAAQTAAKVAGQRAKGDVLDALSAMHQLMNEWNFIGTSETEVAKMIGPPTESKKDSLTYRFDHGKGGWEWVFVIAGGKVIAVKKLSLD